MSKPSTPSTPEAPEVPEVPAAPDAAKQRVFDTTLLRAAATLLICNSHLEAFYRWHWLAADGMLGNSMFFLLSGFGLALSQSRKSRGFGEWYIRRLERIYPALWITMVVAYLLHGWYATWKPLDYLAQLVYPTDYSFIGGIVVLYIPLYLLLRVGKPRVYLLTLLGTMLPYFVLYWLDLRHVPADAPLSLGSRDPWAWNIFYFQGMLLGCWLAARGDRAEDRPVTDWAALLVLFFVYVGLKLYMVRGHFGHYYFLLNWLVFGILYFWFKVGTSAAAVRFYRSRPFLNGPITLLASLTLELYLAHVYVAHNPRIAALPFPLNIIVFFALSIPLAWALGWVVKRVTPRRSSANQARS